MSSQQINNSSLTRGRTLWARIYRFEKYLLAAACKTLPKALLPAINHVGGGRGGNGM
jgi:hypothetical protein